MNIYQKKIIKEKDNFFNGDCVQTKSTYPNSKPDIEADINSNSNINQFYYINSKQINKKGNISKSNRKPRSKSQIIEENKKIEEYIPKEIKTVLIKFDKPLEKNNEKEKNNFNNISELNYRTYFTEKFYRNKCYHSNNDLKNKKIIKYLNNKPNIFNIDLSFENSNYNSNFISFYLPYHLIKNKRNKSAIVKKEYFSNSNNNSKNNSFCAVYKKSFCLDKHKNYGGNFKNKEKSKTNPKIKAYKNGNNIKYKKNSMTKNISSPNINVSYSQKSYSGKINSNRNNILFHLSNNNAYQNIKNNNNSNKNINKSYSNRIKNSNIKYDLTIIPDEKDKMEMNTILSKTENEDINNIDLEIHKKKAESLNKKSNLIIKNIPPLNLNKNIHNSISINNSININNSISNYINVPKYLNSKNVNTSQICMKKNKNSTLTFEEKNNKKNSKKKYSMKNKSNLLNLINISEHVTKRNNINCYHKNSELDKINNNYMKKENHTSKIKMKKNNYNNNIKNVNNSKNKRKIFRTNSIKEIERDNKAYKIKSIPLKLDNYQQTQNNKYNNRYNSKDYNIQNKNKIVENIVFINKNDLNLWNDLTRIYDNNGKFQ